jgi:hypothetical protein
MLISPQLVQVVDESSDELDVVVVVDVVESAVVVESVVVVESAVVVDVVTSLGSAVVVLESDDGKHWE